jgi:hypothetical protein
MLFQVKFEVQALEKQLKALNAQIYNNQQAIHVLTAEWSHLNEPARLTELNDRYLKLIPVDAKQLARLEDLPPRITVPADPGLAQGELQAMVPVAAPSLPKLAPVTRSAPASIAKEDEIEIRPTLADWIVKRLGGAFGADERGAQ